MCIMYVFHAYYSIRDFDKAYYMRIPYVLAVHDFDNTYCRRINGVLAEIFEFSLNKASKVKQHQHLQNSVNAGLFLIDR